MVVFLSHLGGELAGGRGKCHTVLSSAAARPFSDQIGIQKCLSVTKVA